MAAELFTTAYSEAMMKPLPSLADTVTINPIFTVGETLPSSTITGGYQPPGVLDGMGGWKVDETTVRMYTNHELDRPFGYAYDICADEDCSSTFQMTGARLSFYDFDIATRQIKDSGLAYDYVYGSDGTLQNSSDVVYGLGFARFCSAQFVAGNEYGVGLGIEDSIQFGPEETTGGADWSTFVGGSYWALDILNKGFWKVPALGRGAWESITQLYTGSTETVAFVMPDDTSPFVFEEVEYATPLYLYVGEKDRSPDADFLSRNGLRGGKTYVWVPDNAAFNSPVTFNGVGSSQTGVWIELDMTPNPAEANVDGLFGYDAEGNPTQLNQILQADSLGAFKFSRPEDISTYSKNPNEFAVVSTGVDEFEGVDAFGTIYTMEVTFADGLIPEPSTLKILIDADADGDRTLRSPDNLDWADDGMIYIQEDRSMAQTPAGEALFGPNAVNQREAQIVRIDSSSETGIVQVIAAMDRSVVLDPTNTVEPAVDNQATGEFSAGAWESSGIIEVSSLFGEEPGTLFIFNVQAHGITDQGNNSKINDNDLVEGGQLLFLEVLKGESSTASTNMPALSILAVAMSVFFMRM